MARADRARRQRRSLDMGARARRAPSPRRPLSREASLALSRLLPALGPSGLDDSGRIVCGSPDPATGRVPAASIIPDCVPLNLFGGAGSITEEQLAYVMSEAPDQYAARTSSGSRSSC